MNVALLLLAAAFAEDEPKYDRAAAAAGDVVQKPVTALSAELGATFTTGNAYFLALNGGVNGKHDWGMNRFTFGGGVNINLAKIDTDANGTLSDAERASKLAFTSQRVFGAVRYDRFFGQYNSLYLSAGVDRDQFAGVLWRFNEQFGYSRVLLDTEKADMSVEVGVAYTQENFSLGEDAVTGDPINGEVLDKHYIAARLFWGFEYHFNEHVSIGNSLEMYENLFTPVDFRLTNNAFIAAKLSDRFSIKISHRLAFDNQPVPDFVPIDQTTQLTLVATIF